MATESRVLTSSPLLVALASWILPGAGYLLIGQRGRALGVGITIILLFIAGLLIGGVRVIEVPGYSSIDGKKQMITMTAPAVNPRTGQVYVDRSGNEIMQPIMVPELDPQTGKPVEDPITNSVKKEPLKRWSLLVSPLNEIRDKPWSVPQAFTGPIAIAAGICSVNAAEIDPRTMKVDSDTGNPDPKTGTPFGAVTHARINELGSLYLSVAGLLNLMAIIDATWRASHLNEKPVEARA
jgi:hypothetical protein